MNIYIYIILDDAQAVILPCYNHIVTFVENICNISKDNEVIQLGLLLINNDLKALKNK